MRTPLCGSHDFHHSTSTQRMMPYRPSINTFALPLMQDNGTGKTALFQICFKARKDTANTLHVCRAIIQSIMVCFMRLRTQMILLVMKFLG